MAKSKTADPYRRLLRGLLVLLVLTVLFGTGYVLLDKYQQGEQQREADRIRQENERLQAAHAQALAEQEQSLHQAETPVRRPVPAAHRPWTITGPLYQSTPSGN